MRDATALFSLTSDRAATTAAPRAAPAEAPAGSRFADLLQRGQSTHGVMARPRVPAPASPPAAHAAPQDDPPAEPADSAQGAPATASRAAVRTAAPRDPKAAATPTTAPTPDGDGEPREVASDARPTEARADDAGRGSLPTTALHPWLAHLQLDGPSARDGAATDPAQAGAGGAGATAVADATTSGKAATDAAAQAADATADVSQAAAGPDAVAGLGSPPAWQAAAALAQDGSRTKTAAADKPGARDAAQALAGMVPTAAAPRGAEAAAPAPLLLATPVYAPDFAQALGAQVSLLAHDGVQQAELHLNPAEMGPISVQIEIDGTAARVDFGADASATRDIIERGLPDLAAALREQGLTLAGGGVSQHAHERPGADGGRAVASARRAGGDAGTQPAHTLVLPAAEGRLDLYA